LTNFVSLTADVCKKERPSRHLQYAFDIFISGRLEEDKPHRCIKNMQKLSLLFEIINEDYDLSLRSGIHHMCSPGCNDNFLIFLPYRESRRNPDLLIPRNRSKLLRLYPWRLGSDPLRLLQQRGEINDGDPVRVQDSLEVAILWQLDELSNEAVNRYALSVGINEILKFQRRNADLGQGKSARILPAMAAPLRNAPLIRITLQ